MTANTELQRLKTNIANAYTALGEKGAIIPEIQSSENLQTTVNTIEEVNNTQLSVSENGNYTPSSPYTGFDSVTVSIPATFNKVLKRNSSNSFYYLGMSDSFVSYTSPLELTRAPAYTFREAFFDAKYLTSVNFDNISIINGFAFERAFAWLNATVKVSEDYLDISFPSVTTLKCQAQFYYAFENNRNIRSLSFPNLVSITNPTTLSQTYDAFSGQNVNVSSDSSITSPFTWSSIGSSLTTLNFPKLENIVKQCFCHSFRNSNIQTINFDSLQYVNCSRAFDCAFNWPTEVNNSVINLPELLEVKGHSAFGSLAVETLNAPKLKIIGSNTSLDGVDVNASHFEGSYLTTINLPSLEEIWCSDSYSRSGTFANSTELVSAYFPNLHTITNYTGTSSYYDYSIAAKNIFYGCSKLTELHFGGGYEDEIMATPGFSTIWGRGAGNATIYFDLNYATVNFNITNAPTLSYFIGQKEVSTTKKVPLKDTSYYITDNSTMCIFGDIKDLTLFETRNINYNWDTILSNSNTITITSLPYTKVELEINGKKTILPYSQTNTTSYKIYSPDVVSINYTVSRGGYKTKTGTLVYSSGFNVSQTIIMEKETEIESNVNILTENGTIGTSDLAASWGSANDAYLLFNGDTYYGHYSQNSNGDPIIFYSKIPLKITGFTQYFSDSSYVPNSQKLYGSNDGNNWTIVLDQTSITTSYDSSTRCYLNIASFNNSNFYNYYKFDDMNLNSSLCRISEITWNAIAQVSSQSIKEFDLTCNVNDVEIAKIEDDELNCVGNKIGGSSILSNGSSYDLFVYKTGYKPYKETIIGNDSVTTITRSISLQSGTLTPLTIPNLTKNGTVGTDPYCCWLIGKSDSYVYTLFNGNLTDTFDYWNGYQYPIVFYSNTPFILRGFTYYRYSSSSSYNPTSITCYGSTDGSNWENLGTVVPDYSIASSYCDLNNYDEYKYYQFKFNASDPSLYLKELQLDSYIWS